MPDQTKAIVRIPRVKVLTLPAWLIETPISASAIAVIIWSHTPGWDMSDVKSRSGLSDDEFEKVLVELEEASILSRDGDNYEFNLK